MRVGPEDAGLRLDLYLLKFSQAHNLGLSRNFIQNLIASKRVSSAGRNLRAHQKVKPGEEFRLEVPEKAPEKLLAQDIPLSICFEDADVIVINKPSGMLVHPSSASSRDTLVNALLFHCPGLSSVNPQRPGIVHRLDKDTSGLLVAVKNNPAHHHLARQFAAHSVLRRYVALVKGRIKFDEDVIEAPIGRHPRLRQKMSVNFIAKHKSALTRYRVLRRGKQATLLELSPFTGRTHQLRVHLSFIGHPVLGDSIYSQDRSFPRLALHSLRLGFVHPRTDKYVEFNTDMPKEFLENPDLC